MKEETLDDVLKLVKGKEIWITRDRYILVDDLVELVRKEKCKH